MIQCGISWQSEPHTLMCPRQLCLNCHSDFRPARQVRVFFLLHFSLLRLSVSSRSESYPLIQSGNEMVVIGVRIEPALGIGT